MFSVSRRFLPILFCMEEMDFIGWTRYAKVALEPFTTITARRLVGICTWRPYPQGILNDIEKNSWWSLLVIFSTWIEQQNDPRFKKTVTITRVMLEHLINGNKCGWWGRMLLTSWDSLNCFAVRPSKQVLFSTPLIT